MNFYQRVYETARKIPEGRVATYGQIASLITTPRAARVVGFALRILPAGTDVPWQRIINSRGRLSIRNPFFSPDHQARLLKKEGVEVFQRGGQWWVDLEKYLWDVRL